MWPSTPKSWSFFLSVGGVGLELLARALELGGGRRREQADRRKLEGLGASLAEVERLLPREALVDERRLGLGRLLHDERRRRGFVDAVVRGHARGGAAATSGDRQASPPAPWPARASAATDAHAERARQHARTEIWVTKRTPSGDEREQDDPRARPRPPRCRSASDTAQPRSPPCGSGCAADVSRRRGRGCPSRSPAGATSPASAGQPRRNARADERRDAVERERASGKR